MLASASGMKSAAISFLHASECWMLPPWEMATNTMSLSFGRIGLAEAVTDKRAALVPRSFFAYEPIRYRRTINVPAATKAVRPIENRSLRTSTSWML